MFWGSFSLINHFSSHIIFFHFLVERQLPPSQEENENLQMIS